MEHCKGGIDPTESNIEFDHAHNLRLFSFKREGTTPSVILRDTTNIEMYSSGAMRSPVAGGYIQVIGASGGILAASEYLRPKVELVKGTRNQVSFLVVEASNIFFTALDGQATVRECLSTAAANHSVTWPDSMSLYKRGELEDLWAGDKLQP